jgi:hypothetical protein
MEEELVNRSEWNLNKREQSIARVKVNKKERIHSRTNLFVRTVQSLSTRSLIHTVDDETQS